MLSICLLCTLCVMHNHVHVVLVKVQMYGAIEVQWQYTQYCQGLIATPQEKGRRGFVSAHTCNV